MAFISISKLDAAKRQLETAINLFFREADPVSIHTLTFAAHEILSVIAKSQNIPTILKNNPLIKPEREAEFGAIVARSANFFKHGKRDIKETLKFNPESNEYYLLDAVNIYSVLTGENVPTLMAYKAWFCLKYPIYFNFTSEEGQNIMIARSAFNPSNKAKFFELIDMYNG